MMFPSKLHVIHFKIYNQFQGQKVKPIEYNRKRSVNILTTNNHCNQVHFFVKMFNFKVTKGAAEVPGT